VSPEKSGLYYSNKIARIYLLVLEDIMGRNGLNAILKLAGLSHLVDNYPPDDLRKEFDFADFAALNQGLDDMYGPRGGRGLAIRAGRAAIKYGLDAFGPAVGMTGFAMKALPLSAKLKIGLPAMATPLSRGRGTVAGRAALGQRREGVQSERDAVHRRW